MARLVLILALLLALTAMAQLSGCGAVHYGLFPRASFSSLDEADMAGRNAKQISKKLWRICAAFYCFCIAFCQFRVVMPFSVIRSSFVEHITHIIGVRSKPQMFRVYASRIVSIWTIMKYPKSLWNWATIKFPCNSVSGRRSANRVSQMYLTVPTRKRCPSPDVAPVGIWRADLALKSLAKLVFQFVAVTLSRAKLFFGPISLKLLRANWTRFCYHPTRHDDPPIRFAVLRAVGGYSLHRSAYFTIIFLVFAIGGCGSVHYRHREFAADGKTLVAEYEAEKWINALDTTATTAHMRLADGTELTLTGYAQQPDKTVIGAFVAIGQSIVGLGGLALRFVGL